MTNPFLPWLPMYPPDSVPERPWWRENEAFEIARVDGAAFVRSCAVYVGGEPVAMLPNGSRAALLDMLARVDTEHPMEVPPPMVGQVWASASGQWSTGAMDTIVYVGPDPAAGFVCRWGSRDVTLAGVWPPADAVLVAGPTPWGWGVPWVPPGWKP
jgi:hypothetical protein